MKKPNNNLDEESFDFAEFVSESVETITFIFLTLPIVRSNEEGILGIAIANFVVSSGAGYLAKQLVRGIKCTGDFVMNTVSNSCCEEKGRPLKAYTLDAKRTQNHDQPYVDGSDNSSKVAQPKIPSLLRFR